MPSVPIVQLVATTIKSGPPGRRKRFGYADS
jgi:hypothetical protein